MDIYNLKDDIPNTSLTKHKKYGKIEDNASKSAISFQVTNLKQGVKNPNRVNIFVNDKYSFSLDIAQVVDFKLKVGQTLTPERIAECKSASEYGKLYQRTLEWVLIRPRSVRETQDYLVRKIRNTIRGHFATNEERIERASPVTTAPRDADDLWSTGESERIREEYSTFSNQIISRLLDKGYLDDQKFAEYYVENRFVKKGISQKRLKMELMKKGISSDIIEQVLNNRNDEEEIKKIIAKKRAKYDDDKLIAYLVRQGFSYQLAQSLVRETD